LILHHSLLGHFAIVFFESAGRWPVVAVGEIRCWSVDAVVGN
jgi:hypothetical protein